MAFIPGSALVAFFDSDAFDFFAIPFILTKTDVKSHQNCRWCGGTTRLNDK